MLKFTKSFYPDSKLFGFLCSLNVIFIYKVLRTSDQTTTWICFAYPTSVFERCFISAEMFYHPFYFDMIITASLQCFISCTGVILFHPAYPWSGCIAYNELSQLLFASLTFNLHDCRNKAWVVLFTSIRITTASSCVVLLILSCCIQ